MLLTLTGTILPGIEVKRLIDRDDRSDAEVADERAKGTRVLSRRNLEAYLFDDEILNLLCTSAGNAPVFDEIRRTRDETIARKKAAKDDYKSAAGETYVACKHHLGLVKAGNSTKAFMLETLAPLVTEQTGTYLQLKADIFQ